MGKLTAKHQSVLDLLIADPGRNMPLAYQAVYKCTDEIASASGSRLLKNVNFATALAKVQAKVAEKFEVTEARIMQELSRIGFQDIRKLYDQDGNLKPIHELDDDTAAAIAGVEVMEIMGNEQTIAQTKKVKFWPKDKALVDMGKHIGMFKKDAEGTGERPIFVGINLTINNRGSK